MESESHREGDRPTSEQARDALAALEQDGPKLAARVITPWWYHPALGLSAAALVISQLLPVVPAIVLVAAAIAVIPVIVIVYRRQYGVSVSQPAGRRSRAVLVALFVMLATVFIAAVLMRMGELSPWWGAVAASVAFAGTVILGRSYDSAFRADLARS